MRGTRRKNNEWLAPVGWTQFQEIHTEFEIFCKHLFVSFHISYILIILVIKKVHKCLLEKISEKL